ncbi:hypothetical protein GCM10022228_13640 [Halomonas cibimaris]|uniref:Tetratricopeptide repeat protein n=1 Tax=Halomonas cibimaris TaxID=657012 RepID=A0ABP7LMA0_9GAMM
MQQLPEAVGLEQDLITDLESARGSARLWQIQGSPFAGKSSLLRGLAITLRDKGQSPILVQPPARAADAGVMAMVEVAVGLHSHGHIGTDKLALIRSDEKSWLDKLEALKSWLEDSAEGVVLLCDEPEHWHSSAEEDTDHFRQQASAVIDWLLRAPCHRVVTGAVESGIRSHRSWHLKAASNARDWLHESSDWGALADTAQALARSGVRNLESRSPLEVRLLLALAEAITVDAAVRWWGQGKPRRELSRKLVEALQGHPAMDAVLPAWGRISLSRRPLGNAELDVLDAPKAASRAGALLRYCLMYPEAQGYRLHELLKADARDNAYWLSARERHSAHRQLYDRYCQRFEQRNADDAMLLIEECEAFHHAMHTNDVALMQRARPYFATQLDIVGRLLSRERREYRRAAEVFQRAHRWEPHDAYAHHYQAYNLDILAEQSVTVEAHYRRAIELEPDNVWWHSRWISYLITRGRAQQTHNAWLEVLDQFGLPDVDITPSVYKHLHTWIGRLLLHRGQLDMADEVLQGIPDSIIQSEPGLQALKRRLTALLQARRGEAFFPFSIAPDTQWNGPHLAPSRQGERPLDHWLPGRVDAVSEDEVVLHVAEPPRQDERPQAGTIEMATHQFNACSEDTTAERLQAGQFVELAWYADQEMPLIRVHPAHELHDPDLPPLFPDPARYLRRSGWVT